MHAKRHISIEELRLLVSFLLDPAENTALLARAQILDVLHDQPALFADLTLEDPAQKTALDDVVEENRFLLAEADFRALFGAGPDLDLETGLWLLARMESPGLLKSDITAPLDTLALAVDRLIADEPPLPTRPVAALRRQLFDVEGFAGDEQDYYNPLNIYLDGVLHRKRGIPISLSSVYILVAQRLNLPVHGVGLPGHFIVGYRAPRGVVHIDPFNGGKILRPKDCEMLVRRLGIGFKESFLDPATPAQIFFRTVVNLINIYADRGSHARARWLARLLALGD